MSAPHDRPTTGELLESVREWLEREVIPATDGRLRFHARVAANVLGIVERELELGPAQADAHTARAFDVLTSSKLVEALDLSKESPKVRERYGDGKPYKFQYDGAPTANDQFLMARRLVQAGARAVDHDRRPGGVLVVSRRVGKVREWQIARDVRTEPGHMRYPAS